MGTITPSQSFKPGTKVSAFTAVGDVAPTPGASPAKTSTAGGDGRVEFKGLPDGVLYQLGWDEDGTWRTVRVQSKSEEFLREHGDLRTLPETVVRRNLSDRQAQAEAVEADRKKNPLAGSPAPGRTVESNKSPDKRRIVGEPQPGPHQRDVQGVPQRSDTIDGEATPKAKDEIVPEPSQEDVGKNVAQRSSTETGTAAIKPKGEQVPAARQEDVPKGTPQRSATETGEAAPKPAVKGVEPEKQAESSAQRVRGNTRPKPERVTKPKGTVKDVTKTGAPKRSSKSKSKTKS